MADTRDNGLHELAKRVANAEYSVDPGAVADAIVRRRWVVSVAPAPPRVYPIASRRRAHARVRFVARFGAGTSRVAAVA